MRAAVALLLLATLATLAAPLAAAQTLTQPLCSPPRGVSAQEHCTYDRAYLVLGRVLDADGLPAKGAQVRVSLVQEGVVDAQGNPPTETGYANCKGDFEFAFTGLRTPSPAGRAVVTVAPAEGQEPATADEALQPFYRRNDLVVRLPYAWPYQCVQQPDPPWDTQISTKGRILNRTAPYDVGGATFHAKTFQGLVGLYYHDGSGGQPHCPPDGNGGCLPISTDELGNFKYTWTFRDDVRPDGVVEVVLPWGASYNASVDPVSRLAVHRIELSGQGPPPPTTTPGPGLLLVVGALVAGARLTRRLLPGEPR